MNADIARKLLRKWIKKAVNAYKASGTEYTDSQVWETIKEHAEKLAQWEQVKEALSEHFFDRQGLSLTKQIARTFSIIAEVEEEQEKQLSFAGEGFDPSHPYTFGFTEDGEGRKRAAHALTGDEALEAMTVLRSSISHGQEKLVQLETEYKRLPKWRGSMTWAKANEAAA